MLNQEKILKICDCIKDNITLYRSDITSDKHKFNANLLSTPKENVNDAKPLIIDAYDVNSISSSVKGNFNADNDTANRWQYALGEFLDFGRKRFVPNPSDHKYQFARELVSLIKSESKSAPTTVVRELASICVYKGFDVAMNALKEYVHIKAKNKLR